MNELVVNKKKWEVLAETISGLEYGAIISHDQISNLIKEHRESSKYNSIVQRAKKELLRLGKDIECVRGQGYRVLEPDDYSEKAYQSYKQGFNRLKKGNDILEHAPVAHMSDDGRIVHRDISDRARVVFASMAGTCTELKMLAKKPKALDVGNVGRR